MPTPSRRLLLKDSGKPKAKVRILNGRRNSLRIPPNSNTDHLRRNSLGNNFTVNPKGSNNLRVNLRDNNLKGNDKDVAREGIIGELEGKMHLKLPNRDRCQD